MGNLLACHFIVGVVVALICHIVGVFDKGYTIKSKMSFSILIILIWEWFTIMFFIFFITAIKRGFDN